MNLSATVESNKLMGKPETGRGHAASLGMTTFKETFNFNHITAVQTEPTSTFCHLLPTGPATNQMHQGDRSEQLWCLFCPAVTLPAMVDLFNLWYPAINKIP